MPPRVLIVLHQATSTPGKVGAMLEARGYRLERCCPTTGDSLPRDLENYAAAVVFGGPQSANDDDPAIRAEIEWLDRTALPSEIPLLGICLGAQQIARVLGAKVGPHPEGVVERGYYPIEPTGAADDFMDGTTTFYQWHGETFEIPRGAVHLARSRDFEGQAFRYGAHCYALEFHPEMTQEMVVDWCGPGDVNPKLGAPGAQPACAHIDGYARHASVSDRWLARFLDRWVGAADASPVMASAAARR